MRVELLWDEPFDNCVTWQFNGFIGTLDYLPPMSDSIMRAMVDEDARWDVIVNIGAAMPIPRRRFRFVAQPIAGAPPNLGLVVIATHNPITKALIASTLGRDPSVVDQVVVVDSYETAQDTVQQSRNGVD